MGLHFLKTALSLPIPEHKEATEGYPYEEFQPDFVYLPAVDNRNNPLKGLLPIGTEVLKGTLLGTGVDGFPTYSSVSGRIVARKHMMMADGKVRECYEIANDKLSRWQLRPALPEAGKCSKEEILSAIKESGAVGFGGAGFPTYRKYSSNKPVEAIIVNAIECEPYLTTDYNYGRRNMGEVFMAIPYLLRLTGAKKVYVAVKKDRDELIEAVRTEMALPANKALPVSLKILPDRYPMGYERSLVRAILHKEYQALPIEVGCIVNNLYTVMALARRFVFGEVVADRCVTVSGEVSEPKDVVVPAGTLASDLINCAGGPKISHFKLVSGGPMCGSAHDSDYVLQAQCNGVLLFAPASVEPEPCWHCGKCIDNCPMGLQPVQIQMALKANNVDRLLKLNAAVCINCGLCSFVCPSKIDVSDNVQKAKALLMKQAPRQKGAK